jgi:hypothetical protein
MPLEHERAFSANSPVGRYWLRNCGGFRVEGLRGRAGIVEEIGRGPDGVDMLAVRRRGVAFLNRMVMVPAQRVESVDPWDETIVLTSRRRRARDRRVAQMEHVALRIRTLGGAAAAEIARALRDGVIVVARLLAAFGTLLLGLAVLARKQTPHVRRSVSSTATAVKLIAHAYASEARRAWRDEQQAIAAWRESRREPAEDHADDHPLTRAGADDVDARLREAARR